jgi:ankyrin repeat protein
METLLLTQQKRSAYQCLRILQSEIRILVAFLFWHLSTMSRRQEVRDPLCYCREKKYDELFKLMDRRRRAGKFPYNFRPSTRTYILQHAVAHEDLEVIRKLVDTYGCEPSFDPQPLYDAVASGNLDIVKYFVITKGVRRTVPRDRLPDLRCMFSRPIHEAKSGETHYTHDHVEIMKLLLDHGWYLDKAFPRPTIVRESWFSRMTKSITDIEWMCKLMLSKGDVSDLKYVIEKGHVSVVELNKLFTVRPDLCKELHNVDFVTYLVSNDMLTVTVEMIKSNQYSYDVLRCLVQNCSGVFSIPLVTKSQGYLVQNQSSKHCMLLDYACKSNRTMLVKAIVEGNINTRDINGRSPLHVACEHSKLELVSFLVKKACDQSLQDDAGQLPLHVAAARNGLEIVKLVSSCNVDEQDKCGYTPLNMACNRAVSDNDEYDFFHKSFSRASDYKCAIDIVTYLACEKRCKVNVRGVYGQLPMHIFTSWLHSKFCDAKISSLLVKTVISIINRADYDVVGLQDNQQNTLLHVACTAGSLDLVRFLVLEKHSDVNKKNGSGNLPLHIVCDRSEHENITNDQQLLDMVKLVTNGISRESLLHKNWSGTALHLACEECTSFYSKYYKEIVKYLVFDKDCKPIDNPQVFSDLRIAFACEDQNDFELLSVLATEESACNLPSVLLTACKGNNMKAVKHLAQLNLLQKCKLPPSHDYYSDDYDDYSYDYYYDSYHGTSKKVSPLHIACTKSAEMADLLAKIFDIAAVTSSGDTPLHFACRHNTVDVVQLLVSKYQCDQFVQNQKKEFPFHLACAQSLSAVKLLTVNSKLLQATTYKEYTPLHIACKNNKPDIVLYLIDKYGGDVSSLIGNSVRCHPLQLACETGNVLVVKHLVENGGNTFQKFADGNAPVHVACSSGSLEVVQYLIDSGHDILTLNSKKELPLHIACTKSLDLVKITSKKCTVKQLKAKTNDGISPLHIAASSGLLDVVQYLVQEKRCCVFDLDQHGNDALAYACGYQNKNALFGFGFVWDKFFYPAIARYLVQHGCKPANSINCNSHTCSAIQRSIGLRSFDLFEALVESNLNCADEAGNTPLMLLCKSFTDREDHATSLTTLDDDLTNEDGEKCTFFLRSTKFLTDKGCHQHIRNVDGELAVHIACANKHDVIKVIELLDCSYSTAFSRSYVTIKNKDGDTPLHIACQIKKWNVLKYMLRFCDGNDCNIQYGRSHQSLLHAAVISDNVEVVDFLLTEMKGICSTQRDADGAAPVHYSRSTKVLELLLAHNSENINLCTTDGNTPLHIQSLLCSGVSTNINENTPLHLRDTYATGSNLSYAFKTNEKAMPEYQKNITCLLSHDPLVTAKNKDGNTPLHLACDSSSGCLYPFPKCDCLTTIRCFIRIRQGDANYIQEVSEAMSIQNKVGRTPLDIAFLNKKACIIKALSGSPFKCKTTQKFS